MRANEEKIEYYNTPNQRKVVINREQAEKFYVKNDDFVDRDGNPTDGDSGRLTFTNAETISEFNEPPVTLLLKKSVIIPGDSLPTNLDGLEVFLSENKSYAFRLRLLRFTTKNNLVIGFIVPGEIDIAAMAWNVVTVGAEYLSEDDEKLVKQKGTNIIGAEISGSIRTKSEAGLFIPQARQEKTGSEDSKISDAYFEVLNGSI